MNKVITDGVLLMPTAFSEGLDVWSRQDGTPGSNTYENSANAAFLPADADFGGSLELQKNETVQRLRYMGETALLPGCYLRITARVKAISGALPSVRIAGWPGGAGGAEVSGVTTTGPSKSLVTYGDVVEVSAIVGAGARNGVDMVWGSEALYGHFGLDLTGPNGGVVRIDDIVIEDITSAFLRDILAVVDVRDYGAIGDGTSDDSAAFDAAIAAANGRTVLIPAGTFRLMNGVTFDVPAKFEGQVSMPADAVLTLRQNFNFTSYLEAFGDEEQAFRKAFQALLTNADHESLDLNGRKISVSGEIDMQAAVPARTEFNTRRVIRNGQIEAVGSDWDTEVVTSRATYDPDDARTLTNVLNVANVPVGALVEGTGVGREVYVRSKNVGAETIELSLPLFDAAGTQNFTFRRFKYLLNFGGFTKLSQFGFTDVEFLCKGDCSALMLATRGSVFSLNNCVINKPKDRGVTSTGGGCQGMLVDRCQFLSSEDALEVEDRVSIGFNANANDVKVRDNRATRLRHFCILDGRNNIIVGNHFFQGDGVPNGPRVAGIVLSSSHTSSIVANNYVDNATIEWTNEHDRAPEFNSEFSFSSLSVTNNVFLTGDVAPWFNYIVVKPHGAGHFLNGVTIADNRFRSTNGTIDRVEGVDTTFAELDPSRHKNLRFEGNSYHNVVQPMANPLVVEHVQNTEAKTWTIDTGTGLPFNGLARKCDAIVLTDRVRNADGTTVWAFPHVDVEKGGNGTAIQLNWPEAVRGSVQIHVRTDTY